MDSTIKTASCGNFLHQERRYHNFRGNDGINIVVKVTYIVDHEHHGFGVIENTTNTPKGIVFPSIASNIMAGLLELHVLPPEKVEKFVWYEKVDGGIQRVTMNWNSRRYTEATWYIPPKDVTLAVSAHTW